MCTPTQSASRSRMLQHEVQCTLPMTKTGQCSPFLGYFEGDAGGRTTRANMTSPNWSEYHFSTIQQDSDLRVFPTRAVPARISRGDDPHCGSTSERNTSRPKVSKIQYKLVTGNSPCLMPVMRSWIRKLNSRKRVSLSSPSDHWCVPHRKCIFEPPRSRSLLDSTSSW